MERTLPKTGPRESPAREAGGFRGEMRDSEMSELSPEAEARDMKLVPNQSASAAVMMDME